MAKTKNKIVILEHNNAQYEHNKLGSAIQYVSVELNIGTVTGFYTKNKPFYDNSDYIIVSAEEIEKLLK